MSAQELMEQALKLSAEDREWIAQGLWESLDDEPIDPELKAVLDRRWEELESGKVKGIPFEESVARAREALKRSREHKSAASGSR